MFLFESLVKIERKPNKLYLITKYAMKSAWNTSYNQKKDQLQQERKALFAENPALQKKDMWYRVLFFMYCIPMFTLILAILYLSYEYAPEALSATIEMFSWLFAVVTVLSAYHIIAYFLYPKGRNTSYENFRKHHGRFDMNLLTMKTVLVYLLEAVKACAGYYAFIFLIRLVWSIILLETGLDSLITPQSSLGLEELYMAVGVILLTLFVMIILTRILKKNTLKAWEKLNEILGKLESPEPLAAQFIM